LPYTEKKTNPNHIITTGIDLNPYLKEHDKFIIREKYNIASDVILVGSSGRIVWQKGYGQLLSLLETYDFMDKNFHFIIAGDGSLKYHLESEAKEKKLDQYITFIGNIDNIPEFLGALDIYIQPSVTEGFPLSVLEAMALGLPIISSDAGGLKEMIHHKKTGIIYKAGDLNALHNGFLKMFSMPLEELFQLGINARKTVQEKYSINKCSEQYRALYNYN